MSNKEPQNQEKTTEEAAVEKRRRFIKGAGVAAPVVLTLSSPSVFGAFCTSEIMSGNVSQHVGGGSCVLGKDPAYWASQTSFPSPYSYSSPASRFDDTNAFGTANSATGQVKSHEKMSDILDAPAATLFPYYIWVTALLNAASDANYVLSPKQVIDLWKYDSQPSGYSTKEIFLRATWGDGTLFF